MYGYLYVGMHAGLHAGVHSGVHACMNACLPVHRCHVCVCVLVSSRIRSGPAEVQRVRGGHRVGVLRPPSPNRQAGAAIRKGKL